MGVNLCTCGNITASTSMNILDSFYVRCYRWYDQDGIGIKKKDAPSNSALFLGLTLSLCLQFFTFAFLRLISVSPFFIPSYTYALAWLIIIGLCYRYYFYNDRGFAIYHTIANEKVRTLSRAKVLVIMLSLSLLPFALIILVEIL